MNIDIENRDDIVLNKCTSLTPKQIEETLPILYNNNKEAIDNQRILVFLDYWATEGGVILNTETSEAYSIDLRA